MTVVQLVRIRNILTVIFGGLDTNNLQLAKDAARKMASELDRIHPEDQGAALAAHGGAS